MERVVRNRAQCLECGMILESKHHHDWVHCRCKTGGIFVDGGREYLRRGGDLDLIREMAEIEVLQGCVCGATWDEHEGSVPWKECPDTNCKEWRPVWVLTE